MGIEFTGTIIGIWDEADDVKTFQVRCPDDFTYISGQYCMVELNGESRPFTFSTPPGKTGQIELTIKQMGTVTTQLFGMQKGDTLTIRGPFGTSLNFDESVDEDIGFIAGGSGITPFIPSLRMIRDRKLPNNAYLIYSNRTKNDIIYAKELAKMDGDQIHVINTLTDETPQGWKGETGRISKDMIIAHAPGYKKLLWYICGPPSMVENMAAMLISIGVPSTNLRIESWQLPGKYDRGE